ncbi:MAG TPA: hypothetical protein VGR47_06410 [Terracidiphilus sp.]|nr:hypothetical protein [Terracidiphilus sp.]
MPKQDTLTLLDDLEAFGLLDPVFRSRLHHLGDSMIGFRAFASKVGYFRASECNQLLHDRLDYIRRQCIVGALKSGRTMEELVDEAENKIPCHRYANCKKHISDSGCR